MAREEEGEEGVFWGISEYFVDTKGYCEMLCVSKVFGDFYVKWLYFNLHK